VLGKQRLSEQEPARNRTMVRGQGGESPNAAMATGSRKKHITGILLLTQPGVFPRLDLFGNPNGIQANHLLADVADASLAEPVIPLSVR
jgi:hypothetical protein